MKTNIFLLAFALINNLCMAQNEFNINKSGLPPVTASDDRIEVLSGKPVTINVLANDSFSESNDLNIISSSTPKHGSVVLTENSFSYRSDKNFSGIDYFFYTISDSNGNKATAHVEIKVRNINRTDKTILPTKPGPQKNTVVEKTAREIKFPEASKLKKRYQTTTDKRNKISLPHHNKTFIVNNQPTNIRTHIIQNPYYRTTQWKLWFENPETVDGHKVTEPMNRVFPTDPVPGSSSFLNYSMRGDKRNYAGFWDEFYLSQDNKHSYLAQGWDDNKGNKIFQLHSKLMHAATGYFNASNLKNWGVTFTSQSSTQMGHDIANRLMRMRETEIFYYFADTLRAGPAHVSYLENAQTNDLFQALTPILYNSVGRSGSELNAITKLILVSGYLPKDIKYKLKTNGLLPSTLLYIWKAGLPYKVPYTNELRHRVAYLSHPLENYPTDDRPGFFDLQYNESRHMKNMLEIAKNLTAAPPIAILKKINIIGGKVIYDKLKTTWLMYQNQEDITIEVSTEDSFDLQQLPLSYTWTVLYGNKKEIRITPLSATQYRIDVPYNPKLPQGRTCIMLTVNNGHSDSNPAIINIFRNSGKNNLRPTLTGLQDRIIQPGETVEFNIESMDPEGFPTTLYQWADEIGHLDGKHFSWTAPENAPAEKHHVTIISSDGTSGNGYQSKQITVEVKPNN